ncbi:MAG: hypothetical protein ACREAO_09400, partial [Nitrososphaera sp.]
IATRANLPQEFLLNSEGGNASGMEQPAAPSSPNAPAAGGAPNVETPVAVETGVENNGTS